MYLFQNTLPHTFTLHTLLLDTFVIDIVTPKHSHKYSPKCSPKYSPKYSLLHTTYPYNITTPTSLLFSSSYSMVWESKPPPTGNAL